MVHWPGDLPFERTEALQLANGDECNLSEIRGSAHSGTHMDAPKHYLARAAGIDEMPLEAGIGPARVIAIQDPDLIRVQEIAGHGLKQGDRVLFKTRNSTRCWKTSEFQELFVHLATEAANYLAQCRVLTVGVDYLSVGGAGTDGAEIHRILLGAGIWIIEGLNLEHVDPADYEMVCLPLKIVGSDGAPARAALRKI